MTAFVLGNGVSRRGIDVHDLLRHGAVYGCNALYRTSTPTVLVATDRPISEEIQASGYAKNNRFYTRRPLPGTGAQKVPDCYRGFSSGPIAAGLAAMDRHNPVILLGFDLGPDADGRFNNVYADTDFYKKTGDLPTFTGNWVRQLITVARDHPGQRFVRVHGDTTARVADFDAVPNWLTMPISDLILLINKGKGSLDEYLQKR
jgi:hypothetical protein